MFAEYSFCCFVPAHRRNALAAMWLQHYCNILSVYIRSTSTLTQKEWKKATFTRHWFPNWGLRPPGGGGVVGRQRGRGFMLNCNTPRGIKKKKRNRHEELTCGSGYKGTSAAEREGGREGMREIEGAAGSFPRPHVAAQRASFTIPASNPLCRFSKRPPSPHSSLTHPLLKSRERSSSLRVLSVQVNEPKQMDSFSIQLNQQRCLSFLMRCHVYEGPLSSCCHTILKANILNILNMKRDIYFGTGQCVSMGKRFLLPCA